MSNIRLQTLLKNKVEEIAKENNCNVSSAFIYLMLNKIFDLDEFEIDEAITDGGMDKGIDAIFEKDDDGESVLYIVQSKNYTKNPEQTIDENSKNLIVDALTNYILGDYPLENLNLKLKNKVESYRERLSTGGINRIGLIFLTNGQSPGKNIISELEKFKNEQEGLIFYKIITENDLASIFAPVSSAVVDEIKIKIVKDSGSGEKTVLNLPDTEIVQGKVFKVDIVILAEIIKNNPNIFNSNVRAFQSLKNKVNEQIASTLKDKELIKNFIYFNNGITIICDDIQPKPGGEIIVLQKPSIINGCQTASTILEVYNEGLLEENVGFVLVRAVKTREQSIKEKIIKASNTQTAINTRDLISEDPIQKELESQFFTLGYFYERKSGLYRDKPKDNVIDLEKGAQSYLALYLRKPAEAKNKKREIYRSYYEQIFNEKITANQILVSWILFNKINKKIKELRKNASADKKSILGNSIMHLLTLFDEWAIKPSGKLLSDIEDDISILDIIFENKIGFVIKKLEEIIKNIKNKEIDFNYQYFFRNSDSLDKILGTKKGAPKYFIELNDSNINRIKDLRYYKPDEYSLRDSIYSKIVHWNDLFVILVNLYLEDKSIEEDLDFLDSGTRSLLIDNPTAEEKKIRKKLKNGLWVLTNFDSKKLSSFCFKMAKKLGMKLSIKLRPTEFRKNKRIRKKR